MRDGKLADCLNWRLIYLRVGLDVLGGVGAIGFIFKIDVSSVRHFLVKSLFS